MRRGPPSNEHSTPIPTDPEFPVSYVRVLAVAGWTCTGKTRFAQDLADRLPQWTPVVLSQDDYYRDTSHLTRNQRSEVNYDEPESYDLSVFAALLDALRSGGRVPRWVYDFGTGVRQVRGTVGPTRLAIAEGVFALWDPRVRERANLRVLLEGDMDQLLERRIRRDGAERCYSSEEVKARFDTMVIPAQRRYLVGARDVADLIFPMDWGDECLERAATCLAGDTFVPTQHAYAKGTNP